MVSAKIKRQLSVIILLAVFSVASVFLHRADDEMYKEKRAFYQGRNDRQSR